MKRYRVEITDSAVQDMENLYDYIAIQLAAPGNAMSQYNRLAEAIEKLEYMPERYKLLEIEPWKTRGLRRMLVDNYTVFFYISADVVTVTTVLYSASDIERRL